MSFKDHEGPISPQLIHLQAKHNALHSHLLLSSQCMCVCVSVYVCVFVCVRVCVRVCVPRWWNSGKRFEIKPHHHHVSHKKLANDIFGDVVAHYLDILLEGQSIETRPFPQNKRGYLLNGARESKYERGYLSNGARESKYDYCRPIGSLLLTIK